MKTILARTILALASALIALTPMAAPAQQIDGPADAPPGTVAMPLYGSATPGSPPDEIITRFMGRETVLRNITYPTLTPVLPDPAKANGTAVIVLAGGGFRMLSLQNEGWRVARKLADSGVAAFVLKYRLLTTPHSDADFLADMGKVIAAAMAPGAKAPDIRDPAATEDALAALKLVRDRAGQFHIDPARVGMIGFSAGAMATLRATIDDKPAAAAGPDFIGYIYGPMAAVPVPAKAPPMFAALAMDDPLFGNGDWSIASAWHAAGRPVELHVYQSGGHGFGMGRPGTTSTLVMDEFLAWMGAQGLLTAKARP